MAMYDTKLLREMAEALRTALDRLEAEGYHCSGEREVLARHTLRAAIVCWPVAFGFLVAWAVRVCTP